jgi:hypothetical protein
MQGWIGGNPGPVWPPDETFFTEMTAIALVHTKHGFVVAADGLSRWGGDDSTRDDVVSQNESDHEQKVFEGSFGMLDIAWAVSGSVFNRDRSFSLITEVDKALRTVNAAPPRGFGEWLRLFAFCLRDSVLTATKNETTPFSEGFPPSSEERFTFARVLMAGYFNGRPSIAITRLSHEGGVLIDPGMKTYDPFEGIILMGSEEILKRYLNEHEDKRFLKYFSPRGTTLSDGLAKASAARSTPQR